MMQELGKKAGWLRVKTRFWSAGCNQGCASGASWGEGQGPEKIVGSVRRMRQSHWCGGVVEAGWIWGWWRAKETQEVLGSWQTRLCLQYYGPSKGRRRRQVNGTGWSGKPHGGVGAETGVV